MTHNTETHQKGLWESVLADFLTSCSSVENTMSSFKRAVKPAAVPVPGPGQEVAESSSPAPLREAPITGAKPWVSTGLGIVSTGNKQLDDLVGGGTALGTLALIESDCFSNYGETLLLYNLAEAASHQQPILLIAEDNVEAERLITALPYNQTVGSSGANDVAHAENSGGDDTNKLTIAWQYSKYLKNTGELPLPMPCCLYRLLAH
jgi:hypothetical protein